jgi:hypothetical protein
MDLQSLRIQVPESKELSKSTKVRQEVFAPQAEDHLPRARAATGVLMSRPRAFASPSRPSPPSAAETSYHSGIADACITFAVRRSAYPAGTQCQSKPAFMNMNRVIKSSENGMPWLNEEIARTRFKTT